jgi:branched-chain amino acid aminotransferase
VREERFNYEQWKADAKSGRIRESFACGTAAVVTAIGEIKTAEGGFVIGNGAGGEVAESLRAKLVAIQRGEAADPHGWVRRVI